MCKVNWFLNASTYKVVRAMLTRKLLSMFGDSRILHDDADCKKAYFCVLHNNHKSAAVSIFTDMLTNGYFIPVMGMLCVIN